LKKSDANFRISHPHQSPHQLGKSGEITALRYLRRQGYKIIARRCKVGRGEIDIIAYDKQTLVFIEVKTRRSRRFGTPEESVTFTKQKQIRRLAEKYCAQHDLEDSPCRFDVLTLERLPDKGWTITQFRNAFE